jgi:glycosyltransferase involved in cell wall biosynthesis
LEVGGVNKSFPGKLALLQRVLPAYRAPFFDLLAGSCQGGLSLCAGEPRLNEGILTTRELKSANLTHIQNLHLFSGRMYLCWQTGLRGWLDSEEPDALVVEANPRYLSTSQVFQWRKKRSRPVIGWGLGAPEFSGGMDWIRRAGRARFIRKFDALITYSQRGAAEYRDLGFPPDRIFIAPNAVSPRPQHPMLVRPASFKVRPMVLFVGRLQSRKRVDLLVHACSALPPGLQPRLVVIGEGPEQNNLQLLADRVYPSTEFPGPRHGVDLLPFFEEADVFVLPGSGGLAIQEAMSHGLPVIVAEGDGTQSDLVRPANGWQIPSDDLNALAATLGTALADATRLRKMGTESYRIVTEEINLEKMVAVFLQVLETSLKMV